MSHNHHVNICSCGKVISQCKCAVQHKAAYTIPDGCEECKSKSELDKVVEDGLAKLAEGEVDPNSILPGWFRQIVPNTPAPRYLTDPETDEEKILVSASDINLVELEVYNLFERVLEVLRNKSEEPLVRCLRAEIELIKFRDVKLNEVKK